MRTNCAYHQPAAWDKYSDRLPRSKYFRSLTPKKVKINLERVRTLLDATRIPKDKSSIFQTLQLQNCDRLVVQFGIRMHCTDLTIGDDLFYERFLLAKLKGVDFNHLEIFELCSENNIVINMIYSLVNFIRQILRPTHAKVMFKAKWKMFQVRFSVWDLQKR